MSNEYIRKDIAVDELQFEPIFSDAWNALREARDRIKAIKSADVAPVVHAHWIRHDNADVVEGYYVPEYECSKCRAWKEDDSDYCPDCGAKMDGEE